MTKDALYPQPPHLSISIWSPDDEESVFGRACDVAVELGCRPSGVARLAPRGEPFELVHDLEATTEQLAAAAFETAVHGGGPLRAVKAGFQSKAWGTVIVEHTLGPAAEPHPTAISLSGDLLSPLESQSRSERRAAQKLSEWSVEVLRELSARCSARYGTIAVEVSMPTPAGLRAGERLQGDIFVAAEIDRFRAAFGPVGGVVWPQGEFFSRPPVDDRALASGCVALGYALAP
ncbi:hypothetical protein OG394_39910 [Kribbella sp. NBC_01245]|uniref:hypothetical protein n=1 Tax=Kribbella sp. NBC_01245 TaxID=2903578 RepID=UPI002E2B54C1|nr:hypothetical protein [Kribbella sp. NBC_01245]